MHFYESVLLGSGGCLLKGSVSRLNTKGFAENPLQC